MWVWGGWVWRGNAVLHAVLGRLRLYQYFIQGDYKARAIIFLVFDCVFILVGER